MRKPVEPFYSDLGRRLHDARMRRGLSQDALARRLSPPVTRAAIANMELGKQRVLTHVLAQIAQVLDVPPAELLPHPEMQRSASFEKQVEAELAEKLNIPRDRAKALTHMLGTGLQGKIA